MGLDTDGCASNNDLDLFGEMATAAKLLRRFGSLSALWAQLPEVERTITKEDIAVIAGQRRRVAKACHSARRTGGEVGRLLPGIPFDVLSENAVPEISAGYVEYLEKHWQEEVLK